MTRAIFFKKKEVAYLLDGFKFSWVHRLWLQLTSRKKPVIVLIYLKIFFLSDFQMNMKIKQARLLFFGFYESWFGT